MLKEAPHQAVGLSESRRQAAAYQSCTLRWALEQMTPLEEGEAVDRARKVNRCGRLTSLRVVDLVGSRTPTFSVRLAALVEALLGVA